MQSAPAPTPTQAPTSAPPMFHRAHRCHKEPSTQTYCGLKTRGPSLNAQETRKRIPCVVCDDLQATPCDLCGEYRP